MISPFLERAYYHLVTLNMGLSKSELRKAIRCKTDADVEVTIDALRQMGLKIHYEESFRVKRYFYRPLTFQEWCGTHTGLPPTHPQYPQGGCQSLRPSGQVMLATMPSPDRPS